jgi:c-di-AMP phosphodiesterase-like protein
VNEINILENQLIRMRSMNKFYHLEFLKDVRYFFAISIISLIISFNNQNVLYLLPLISLFGSVMLAFHAYFLIFSRNYSEYLEKKINKQSNSEIFITHKL